MHTIITDLDDLKDLPPGTYVIAGEAAAEMMRQQFEALTQRLEDLEEETGIAQKRRDKAERQQLKTDLLDLYTCNGFELAEANRLAKADIRQGLSFDQASHRLNRKQYEAKHRAQGQAAEEREKRLRLILSHLRNMRRVAITIEREEEYIRAIKAAHPEELIREALGVLQISLSSWGYENEQSDK